MFKGSSTLSQYEDCIKSGLCDEHCREINQNELAALRNEFPRKAFRYIRINILYPLLFKKTPKCPKIKLLMERTPALAKILQGDISKDVETILTLDSVVVFTLCQLSKICCIGALFHMKKKMHCEDLKLKPLCSLLLQDQLDKNAVQYLYPVLQKNFIGYDLDILKASHVITLIFVRNFCSKFNINIAIDNIEKDIMGDTDWKDKQTVAELYFHRSNYQAAADMFVLALLKNMYSSEVYCQLARCYRKMFKHNVAMLYSYLAVSMDSACCEAYVLLTESLFQLKKIDESREVAHSGLMICQMGSVSYTNLKLLHNQIKSINRSESTNDILKSSVKQTVFIGNKEEDKKIVCVKLIDSDSAESEDESDNIKDPADGVSADDASDCTTTEKQPPSTPEGTKKKPKRNRTLSDAPSEGSSDKKVIDVVKINLLLKEASEALLGDCGYKAVQIFRGPLRDVIEKPELLPFEECDVVCMKYSYGIAYCKSGAYDDLQKCITILKEILSQHDSVTFPAVHFSLGVAYRKLNRFKESLHYLEIVRSFLDKGFHFKVYPWPGTTTVIQETKPDVLKALVEDLIRECENPPSPDAYCRLARCLFQPTIYYSDPDFKGYFSLSCSEQCCMQYHLQCWKVLRTERDLTDKEFLEKPCFTPDCEGVIVKIQNIDKKGDLSREFVSDYRKTTKQKRAKSEKKTETKDRKKKKLSSKCNEVVKSGERKISSATEESIPSSDSLTVSVEEAASKSDATRMDVQDAEACSEEKGLVEIQVTARENDGCSPTQNTIESSDASSTNGEGSQSQDSRPVVDESVRENLYSFMADFLHHHGPLKVNDTMLVDELSSFPDEAVTLIDECGGIGEFLKQDLKFAYVGDTYVCHVIDVAQAYKMYYNSSSLPSDFEQYTPYSDELGFQNCGLNPDAQEYKPSNVIEKTNHAFEANGQHSKSEVFKSYSGHLNHSHEVIRPTSLSESAMFGGKIRRNGIFSNERSQKSVESRFETVAASDVNEVTRDEKSELSSGSVNPDLETAAPFSESSWKVGNISADTESANQSFSNSIKLEVQLQSLITQYFSKEKEPSRQHIDSYLKPYVIKKMPKYASTATMTDSSANCDKSIEETLTKELERSAEQNAILIKNVEASTRKQQELALKITQLQKRLEMAENYDKSIEETLTKELERSAEQTAILIKNVEASTRKQQELALKITQLQKRLEMAESQNKEFEDKEQDYQEQRQYILKALSDAHKTIDEQNRTLTSLGSEKEGLEKNVENLTHSQKKMEEKLKHTLETQEKQFSERLKYLQSENADLKKRAKYAELQVLHSKKTEQLKKMEAKMEEAIKREKEIADGLSVMSCSPVIQNNMKVLSSQLLVYVNKLKSIKQEFLKKIDKEIEQVNSGTPLRGTHLEFEMELPEIPCLKNIFPANACNMPFSVGMSVPPFKAPLLPTPVHIPAATSLIPSDVTPAIKTQVESSNNGALDFMNFNPQIEESFKSGMASINSFASAPYPMNDEFQKSCSLFKEPMPMAQPEKSKVPPGIQNPPAAAPPRSHSSSFGSIDSLSKIKVDQSSLDVEKRKAAPGGKSNYEKLLNKLKEQFPEYTQDELVSFLKDFRAQRQGKLSGLPFDKIISEISAIIMNRKRDEKLALAKVLPKNSKILVNKKLVMDPKSTSAAAAVAVSAEKRKTAWGVVEGGCQRRFSGSLEDDCSICCDPMTQDTADKMLCGHVFHRDCIHQWLKTKSDCPVCRVLLLLPEEYPSLT